MKAIEEDDLADLPGTFFYKSFVRQYAALLGVPEKRIQSSVEAATAATGEPPLPGQDTRWDSPRQQTSWVGELKLLATSFRTGTGSGTTQPPIRPLDPIVESDNRYFSDHRIGASLTGLAVVLLSCSLFYAWWNRTPKAEVAQAPKSVPVQNVSSDPATHSPVSVTTSQNADGSAELNLAATDEVWVSVTANGKEVFSGVLKPSQTKTLTGIEAAQMKVGNAGGLDVKWKGKPIGPIGPRGQVRTVVLTPENFEVLPPPAAEDDTL